VVLLQIFEPNSLFCLLILFFILVFYFRITETNIRLAEERNKQILLRLAEANRAPQLRLPLGDPPTPARRRRRQRRPPPTERLPGI
jgi:hypothetical protein